MKRRKERVILSCKQQNNNKQKCNKLHILSKIHLKMETLDQMRRTQIIYGKREKCSLQDNVWDHYREK